MMLSLATAFAMTLITPAGPPEGWKPDKVIETVVRDGKLTFTEKGKEKPVAITLVVGQTVRWVNCDTKPHQVLSVDEVDGKPLIDTGVIEPGKHRDVILDNDLYRRAKGKTAGMVTIKFRSKAQPTVLGELQLLSPAKR